MSKSKAAAKPTPSTTSTSSSWRPLLLVLLGALAGFFAARFQGADVSTPVQVEVDVTPSPAAPTPDASAASAAAANAARAARDVWTPDATTRVVSVSELREHRFEICCFARFASVLASIGLSRWLRAATLFKARAWRLFVVADGASAVRRRALRSVGSLFSVKSLTCRLAVPTKRVAATTFSLVRVT